MVTSIATELTLDIFTYTQNELTGTICNDFLGWCVNFNSFWEMISVMEEIFNKLAFPQTSVSEKQFIPKTGRNKKNFQKKGGSMEKKDTNGKAKFIVNVQYRQNATWQGTIQWVEENKTQNFRSALEMIKLMDEALESNCSEDKVSFKNEN